MLKATYAGNILCVGERKVKIAYGDKPHTSEKIPSGNPHEFLGQPRELEKRKWIQIKSKWIE